MTHSISQANQNVESSAPVHTEKLPLSVIILTKNEELLIERCLQSVRWASECVVIDSGSVDRTKELAAALGAKVYEQEWLGWSAQRNKGISLAKHDWVFVLEADEIVSPELAASIKSVMTNPRDDRDGYSIDRRDDYHGVLMPSIRRRSNLIGCVRLFNRTQSSYDLTMKVHEKVRCPGKTILMSGILLHWRSTLLDEQISCLNRYATIEAEMLQEQGCQSSALLIVTRPILRFLWCYVAKGCFRKGIQGLNYSIVRAISDYVRYAKLWEMQNVTYSIDPPADVYQVKAED
ncbi:MAG: glycosyltransferase family 2 protein [Leptolyngbyaceae cyanobacterium SM1_3_5]|nr:glycosyltransferase family 2 protein [Leptolyngbyaceae cyanobacterium SM1_3_5]